jgi:PAS domain-containing protein
MMDKTSEKERINEMIEAFMKVAKGDYSVQIKLSDKNDDLDSLAMGLNLMIDDIRTIIIERKWMEETLRQKLEEQKVLLSTIQAFVYFKDRNLNYIVANKAFADMTGTPLDEIVGKNDYDLFPKEEAEFYRMCDRDVMESNEPQYNIEKPVTGGERGNNGKKGRGGGR